MGFLNHKETAQQKALDDSARNFTLQQYAYAKEILHHPSLLWDGIKNDVREVAHHPLESAWNGIKSATITPLKGMRDYGHSLRTQMRVDSHMPVSQKDIDDYGAQAIAGSYHALSPIIGGLAGRGIGEAIEGSMGGIIRHMSDEDLSKLVLLKQGEGVAAHIPPRKLGDQKYGHILERLSIIDNAQPPFGSGNYKPRSGGYHFPPNGAQHPKPYQQLHRALLLGEMDHPFIGNNLPIILREGNNELGNRHMEGGHGNDIRKYYENAVAHGQDVIGNATHLYYNPVTTSFLFVKKIDGVSNNKNVHPTVAVRLDKDHHDHFTVITGYNERWKRIDDGKNQFIKDNADGSGIVRPIDSSPDYESAWHQSQISQAGSVTGSGDHRPPIKGGSSHPTWLHNIGNSEHVKHHFAGIGSFTASQAQQAHQQYQNFEADLHKYTPPNPPHFSYQHTSNPAF